MKKLKEIWRRELLRPMIYMTFTRFILGLFIALLADFFLSASAGRNLKETLFLLTSAVFAVLFWIAWLRLDGIKLPKFMMKRINPRKKPSRMYGDMIDYVDENAPETFEDLEDNEKDVCILGADAACCILFLIISFFI